MSGFTSQALEKKLIELNNSQQSIQTLSLWLIHHRKHHKSIVQTWTKELKKGFQLFLFSFLIKYLFIYQNIYLFIKIFIQMIAKPNRKLTFMYLANDVIQNSRKKGPEFSKEFGAVLKSSFENVAKYSSIHLI
jgi:regulator of Ty1 transposition protein 103